MFYRHLCLYIALLLNDWSNPMFTLGCFSRSDCNNYLIMTHFWSNDSISIMKSITLVNARDFSHCAEWELPPSILKLRYSFTGGGILWLVLWFFLLSWYCSDSDPKNPGHLVQWHCDCFVGVFQTTGHCHQHRYF